MEQKNNNTLITILSLIAIIALVVFVIVMAVKGLNKDKTDDSVYDIVRDNITVTPTPTQQVEDTNDTQQTASDITALLNSFANDMTTYLECNNPNIISFSTPGLTLEKLGGMRTALGQSTVETWTYWQADSTLSTAPLKGDYVVNYNIGTSKGSKKLYVYLWINSTNSGKYISMINYEIGDF